MFVELKNILTLLGLLLLPPSVLLIPQLLLFFLLHPPSQAAEFVQTVSLQLPPSAKIQVKRRRARRRMRRKRKRKRLEMMMMMIVERAIRTQANWTRKVMRRKKPLLCGLAHQNAILVQAISSLLLTRVAWLKVFYFYFAIFIYLMSYLFF